MDKMLARFSWMGSMDVMGHDDGEDIPLPEEDESLIDTQFIHWGYVNSCQRVAKGKKGKKEKWNTYWLELCGSTLRFYKDSSLNVESALFPPPTTFILAENETKVAFFELGNAEVHILSEETFSNMAKKRTKKSVSPQVYRRHLIELKLHSIRSTYIFQAPSRSAMLRWVSKIQESIDAIQHDEIPNLAEERLKLARDMRGVKSSILEKSVVDEIDGDDDSISSVSDVSDTHNLNPTLMSLKKQLASKKEQIWQFEAQLIDFYGRGKGAFKRDEFTCTTNQDYFLVPGRIETFVPAGTKVTIFGQLPNRRWRCVVEMNELVKVMEILVNELKNRSELDLSNKGENLVSCRGNKDVLDNLLNNLPDYPLLGCLPTSVLNLTDNSTNLSDHEETIPQRRSTKTRHKYNVTIVPSPPPDFPNSPDTPNPSETYNSPERPDPTHYLFESSDDSERSSNSGNSGVNIGDIDIKLTSSPTNEEDAIVIENLKLTDFDHSNLQQSESESASEEEEEEEEEYEEERLDVIENLKLRHLGEGIVIRNKLRQKGISIVVGDSSSEDEEESTQDGREKCNGIANAVFQKYVNTNKPKKSEELERSWNSEDKCDITRPVEFQESLSKSSSCDSFINIGEFTANPDLLHRFGQQAIHLEQDKALAKALVQVFHESKKGPDVKPPRNERRTLKLSKSDDQGFGFWLQTYDLGKTDSVKMSTFVRYVEDEGPAYLAGLRAGDVIVEVNSQDVEDIEHMKIVGLISETPKELILVVKFLDMVRHVELNIRLKNRQAKLKLKEEELEKIKEEEKKILESDDFEHSEDEHSLLSLLPASSTSSTYSMSLDGDLDLVSLDTSTESLGSPSSISEDVTITTSKFEKCSPRVLDSIKEINCVRNTPGVSGSNNKLDSSVALATTDKDLLNMHSDKDLLSQHSGRPPAFWNRSLMYVKHTENMTNLKRNSLPLSLESFETRSMTGSIASIESEVDNTTGGFTKMDTLSCVKLGVETNPDNRDEVFVDELDDSLSTRTSSYKRAVEPVNVIASPPHSDS